jgi:hypothetical protein
LPGSRSASLSKASFCHRQFRRLSGETILRLEQSQTPRSPAAGMPHCRHHAPSPATSSPALPANAHLDAPSAASRLRHLVADAGNVGSLPTSRRSCWMMTALRLAAICFRRSIDACDWERSLLKAGTPPAS